MFQPQKPIPISEMPDEFKDGRPVLLFGGYIPQTARVIDTALAFRQLNVWRITESSTRLYSPTHFLPVWQGELPRNE
jgi:hypothetical protein